MEVDYFGIIMLLLQNGYTIVEVYSPERKYYFVAMEFVEPYFNSAQSVDYGTIKGTEITEFLKKNDTLSQPTNLIHNLNRYIDEKDVIELKFSKNMQWTRWCNLVSKR